MNHVTLIGRITKDLVLRQTSTGKSYLFFTVAIDNISSMNNKTDFVNCVAWNKVAENMAKFVGKGSLIAVAGRIVTRKDNQNQFIMEVSASNVTFLDSRRRDSISNSTNNDVSNMKKTDKANEVNIEQALQNTESYDTEISFVNNNSLDSSDSDDEAIIWD